MKKVKEMPIFKRPREKLQEKGPKALSDKELLAILLGSGTQTHDVLTLIQHMADRKQEHFLCISLNGAYEVIAVRTVSVGLVNKTQVHPREVFADPITDRATAIIVAHNHPTGNLTPSKDDIVITRQLKSAGETLGIKLLDHIIFSHKGYYSLMENGEWD